MEKERPDIRGSNQRVRTNVINKKKRILGRIDAVCVQR